MSSYRPVNRIAEYAGEGKDLVAGHPVSTVVAAFGLGLATGLALVTLLSGTESHRDEGTAHRLGQHLLDAVSSVVPDAVARTFRS
jgi:hypothetical protein